MPASSGVQCDYRKKIFYGSVWNVARYIYQKKKLLYSVRQNNIKLQNIPFKPFIIILFSYDCFCSILNTDKKI